jgi:hypothetical protein
VNQARLSCSLRIKGNLSLERQVEGGGLSKLGENKQDPSLRLTSSTAKRG